MTVRVSPVAGVNVVLGIAIGVAGSINVRGVRSDLLWRIHGERNQLASMRAVSGFYISSCIDSIRHAGMQKLVGPPPTPPRGRSPAGE